MKTELLINGLVLTVLLISCNTAYACVPPLPVAVLAAEPEHALPDESVLLDGSASYDVDGNIVKYEWDFTNDGTYDYYETPYYYPDGAFDGKTTHIYDEPNTYTAKLRVTDNDLLIDTDTCKFYVDNWTRYYVDPDGDDENDGRTWATAFATIQKGITEANDGDANGYAVVDVNTGTYEVSSGIIIDNNYIRIVFEPSVEVVTANDANWYNPLFTVDNKHHITFDGNDAMLRMKLDLYSHTNWSDCIGLWECNTMLIFQT